MNIPPDASEAARMNIPPGTYGVVSRSSGVVSAAIRLVTRSRYSHAFLVLDDDTVIESAAQGAIISPLAKYTNRPAGEIAYNTHEPLSNWRRARIVARGRELAGTPYGYLDVAALLLASIGIRPSFIRNRVTRSDRLICSQLVDVAYQRGGYHLFTDGRPPQDVTPGDLAQRITETIWEQA